MIKDIEQLRKEKEREEERKILKAINDNCKKKQQERKEEERKQQERKEQQEKEEDRKALIQVIILIFIFIALLSGLLKLANNMDQKDFERCQENGGSVEYCKKVIE